MARKNTASSKSFGGIIAVVAVAGIAALGYVMSRPTKVLTLDATLPPMSAAGVVRGNPDALVQVTEFADFECPGCGQFATVTEPDVRKRIIEPGLASLTFYDFPLPQHKNSQSAHNAAACAGDQNKFWEMHDRLFAAQDQWNTQATDNPKPFFQKYASDLGLDAKTWEACYDARKHQGRILANMNEGEKRDVGQTPTFIIGTKKYPGALPYDALKAIVDSATQKPAAQ